MFRLAWRFFTGAHLDGRPRTNATWRKPGTLPRHKVGWWNAKPRLHRMAWRNAIFWCLTLTLIGAWRSPWLTLWLWSAVAPFAVSKIFPRIRSRFVRRVRVHTPISPASDPHEEMSPEELESVIDEIAADMPPIEAIPIRPKRNNRRQAQ